MATFNFNCPQCGNMLSGEDEWRGRETQCPKCQKTITIPANRPLPTLAQPVLAAPAQPVKTSSNIVFENESYETRNRKWNFDRKFLRITKLILFLIACFFIYNTFGIFSKVDLYSEKSLPAETSPKSPEHAYELKSEYGGVHVADSTHATYKNTAKAVENTRHIANDTEKMVKNTYAATTVLHSIGQLEIVIFNWCLSIFFLLLSIFIDKIFLPFDSSAKKAL